MPTERLAMRHVRCKQIDVGRDADPQDSAAGRNGTIDGVRIPAIADRDSD
jgi:hypothetical protein